MRLVVKSALIMTMLCLRFHTASVRGWSMAQQSIFHRRKIEMTLNHSYFSSAALDNY